jgi:hypothetical protein
LEVATRKTQKSQPKKTINAASKNHFEAKKPGQSESNGFPSADQIRARAYELYQARGGRHGNDWSDWFEAEQQLVRHSPSLTG